MRFARTNLLAKSADITTTQDEESLRVEKNYAIEYYESPPPKHELTKDTKDTDGTDRFARSIAALVGPWPASTHFFGRFMRVEAHETGTIRSGLRESNPLRNALAGVIQSLKNQWFGPTAPEFGGLKRLFYASTGAYSCFLTMMFYGIFSREKNVTYEIFFSDYSIVLLAFFLGAGTWFGWLVAWGNQQYGPIRLYLSGFLLPYISMFLVSKLFQITYKIIPDVGGIAS